MMGRLFSILMLALTILVVNAGESYVVYAVHGKVFECDGNTRTPILPRTTHLTDKSLISIMKGGSLSVYMSESRCMATISEIGTQRLGTLIGRSQKTSGASTKWVAALVKSLIKSDTPENTHRRILQSQGGSHRGDDDDRMVANAVAGYLSECVPLEYPHSVSVRFQKDNGEYIDGDILAWQDDATAEISNHSNEYLFVNLLAVTPDSERQLLFPVDTNIDNNCCAHLLVPPRTTVSFSELSFFPSFLEPGTRIIPIASPNQINFTALCRKQEFVPNLPVAKLLFGEIH